ncbi:MAG: NAD(P)/FAD-dependent oxidoreductase [Spirochaetes bacterium]|nr:NAD(P)/FAD-dependent oxidoreductase [Spirochaetota bacterium]
MVYDVLIIGGGVVGCAIARELSSYRLQVALLEKEGDVAEGTSKANSGVVHAGFNVKTGSLKARFNIEGANRFPAICEELGVPYRLTKKLVVAKDRSELPYLEKLLEQGNRNGSRGLSIIAGGAIQAIEPDVRGEFALYSERTGVIAPTEFTIALAEVAHANGVEFRFNSEVKTIKRMGSVYQVAAADGSVYSASIVINSAGLYSDRILSMVEEHDRSIHPCRGEYFVLDRVGETFLRTAVYPVPPADGRGLGIHLTPTTEGNIIIGPSAEYIDDRDDLATTKSVMDTLKREAIELMPKLKDVAFIRSYAGIRPKLFVAGGSSIFEDFIIEESRANPGFISLIGIESPGLTSAPAIAEYVTEQFVAPKKTLIRNPAASTTRPAPRRIADMDAEELAAAYRSDPAFGEIVCRCNHVSKAEIEAALENPLGARTLSAVKKRTHAMMGRCQSGFCLPKILEIMIEEYGMDPGSVVFNAPDSKVVIGYEA